MFCMLFVISYSTTILQIVLKIKRMNVVQREIKMILFSCRNHAGCKSLTLCFNLLLCTLTIKWWIYLWGTICHFWCTYGVFQGITCLVCVEKFRFTHAVNLRQNVSHPVLASAAQIISRLLFHGSNKLELAKLALIASSWLYFLSLNTKGHNLYFIWYFNGSVMD